MRKLLNKKIIIIIILASLFALSVVHAQDNITCENDVAIFDDEAVLNASANNFAELNHAINDNNDRNIYLNHDFTFDNDTDSKFKDGILINRSVNIFGNGHMINATGNARIFNIISDNVCINGVTFVNGYAQNGGAITGNSYSVIDCKFISNKADNFGGAIFNGYANNCTFEGNTAMNGGAIYNGSAEKCNFKSNEASFGGAIYDTYAVYCEFTSNYALVSSGAMEGGSAYNCTFNRNSALKYGAASNANLIKCYFNYNNASTFGGAIGGGCFANNCSFVNNYAVNEGGAVYASYVNNSEFWDNHANHGGAISGNVHSVENSIFFNNYANERGGALNNIYAYGCEFRRNHAQEGGAMYGSSAKNCTFISNYATSSSGGIKGYSEDCFFIDNSAYRAGACEGDSLNSKFEENHAQLGGAIYGNFVNDCIFIDNNATEGGAIYGGSAVLCSFIENHAKTGGAMYSGAAVSSNFTKNVAEISGGAYYRTSLTDCILKDNLPKYKLTVSGFEAIYGFGCDIHVILSDSQSYMINNIKSLVKIYDSDNRLVFVSSCFSGGTCFVDLDLGEFTLVVSVDDSNYNADPVTSHITIKKASSFYVKSVTATYGINNPLIINLHDADGSLIKNTQVKVNVGGVIKTYTTNKNGQILLDTSSYAPGTHHVAVTFNGNSKYFKSSASAKITVNKAKPFIIVSNMKYFAKEKVKKFYMILKDNRYRPMKNTKVTLKVNGKTYVAKTNSNGRATFKITKLNKKGKYTATAKYAGNKYYTALSQSAKITVKK